VKEQETKLKTEHALKTVPVHKMEHVHKTVLAATLLVRHATEHKTVTALKNALKLKLSYEQDNAPETAKQKAKL